MRDLETKQGSDSDMRTPAILMSNLIGCTKGPLIKPSIPPLTRQSRENLAKSVRQCQCQQDMSMKEMMIDGEWG